MFAASLVAVFALFGGVLAGCGSEDTAEAATDSSSADQSATEPSASEHGGEEHGDDGHSHADATAEPELYAAMRTLWDQHMAWTYATINAFALGSPGFDATLTRLLQNQTDTGNAIKPYYGEEAGNQLSDLLHEHIEGYVPVLKAAKAGDSAGAEEAFQAVLANGVEIGKFLAAANPENWDEAAMVDMMNVHNNQTLKYAGELLKADYDAAIKDYGVAEQHMNEMADMLSAGIVAQFPDKF